MVGDRELTDTTVSYILSFLRDLFREGAGFDLTDSDPDYVSRGIIDDFSDDTDTFMWISNVLRFTRFLYGVLSFDPSDIDAVYADTLLEE